MANGAGANAYKIVFAPPTDTDPPTNPIAVIDQIIGINPPEIAAGMWADPYNYGAVGDGIADDTDAMQRWLDAIAGGIGYGKTGTFMASETLIIHSDTTIFGAGVGSFVIMTQPAVPQNFQLLNNEHIVSSPSPSLDRNIAIYGTCFQGDPLTAVTGTTEFVHFVGVDGLTIRNCLFQKRLQSLLSYDNCSDVVVDNNEFFDYGIRTYSGASGLYNGGTAIISLQPNYGVRITNNYVHLGAGGIWLPFALPVESLDCVCSGNIINDVCEFGIASAVPDRCVINDNIIANVHKVDVDGHGMQLFGNNFMVSNNVIIFCDGACMLLVDPVGVSITSNLMDRSNQQMAVSGGALTVQASGTAGGGGPLPPSYLTISDNNIFNTDAKGASAIKFTRLAADPTFLMNNVQVKGNNLGPNFWTTGIPIDVGGGVEATVRGANFMIRDNLGAGANDWAVNVVSFIIPAGSSGTLHIGAVGFRSTWIQFQAVLPSPSGAMAASIGQNSWSTGWDIAGQTPSFPKVFGASTGIAWSTDGTDSYSADFGGRSSINIFDATGKPICAAGLLALDDDGFDILILESVLLVLVNAGADYAVGDTGTVTGGDGLLTYTVTSIGGSGEITGFTWAGGSGYLTGTSVSTTPTSGIGSGFIVDVNSGSPTTEDVVVTAVCHA